MMDWIDSNDQLPHNSEQVLGLIEGYFVQDSPLMQKRSFRIFQCTFHRFTGWHIPFCPEPHFFVKYWMPKPKDPSYEK